MPKRFKVSKYFHTAHLAVGPFCECTSENLACLWEKAGLAGFNN